MKPQRALTGFTVLDLGIMTAGAATSALLADAGARVIKIESERYPDPFRKWSGAGLTGRGSSAAAFDFTNRNKMGVSLDLKTQRGREAFLKLSKNADLVVENFRRGVLEKLGLGFEELRKQNPRIVLASLSSQGDVGPEAHYKSFGSTLEAMGGLAAITGYAGENPQVSGKSLNFPDQAVSIFAFGAIIAALLAAKRKGQGEHIDISQRELILYMVGEYIAAESVRHGSAVGELCRGNADASGRFQGCFRTAERRWVAITAPNETARNELASICGANSPGDSNSQRDLLAAVTTFVAQSRYEIVAEVFGKAGVSVTRVLAANEVLNNLKNAHWHAIMPGPAGGLVKGVPFLNRISPFCIERPAPKLGEHSDSILAEINEHPSTTSTDLA
ncbi:MAG: CoA transferase [Xanthobacteraceae bacterium]|nr:CoA transferase [Xanthobacteraceae bacterium]